MKTIVKMSMSAAAAALLAGCSLFELDNKDLPAETFRGKVVDAATDDPVLTDQSGSGIRVRLTETSYKGNESPTHNPDFWCRNDGTFQNTKLFKGTYKVEIDGPFVPLYIEQNGVPVVNDLETNGLVDVKISGTVEKTIKVQPFLRVEWVDEPSIAGGIITCKIKVTRATSVADCTAKMQSINGWSASWLNLEKVVLFVSYSNFVGNGENDERWRTETTVTNTSLDQTITIRSTGTIPEGRTVFVRPAARVVFGNADASAIKNCYNYGETRKVLY